MRCNFRIHVGPLERADVNTDAIAAMPNIMVRDHRGSRDT